MSIVVVDIRIAWIEFEAALEFPLSSGVFRNASAEG